MNENLKKLLKEIIKNDSELLVEKWIKYFDEEEKEDEARYYEDFLGFFEECVESNLDLNSPEAKALEMFLLKIIELIGEEEFFNFKNSVYTCYLKFPIYKRMSELKEFKYEYAKILTEFFEGLASKIIGEILEKNKTQTQMAMEELEEREAPISEIWDKVLMVSIVGTLDSDRIIKIIDKVLNRLEKNEVKAVIVDIGAIYDVNSEVSRQLMKLNNAIRFMGAEAYLTGITASIAKSLTHLEINLGNIKTFSTTKQAMEYILNGKV